MRTDSRVRVMERTNLRALRLPDIGGRPVDLVTLDLSFISVLKVLDAVGGWGRRERLVLTMLDAVGGWGRRGRGRHAGRVCVHAMPLLLLQNTRSCLSVVQHHNHSLARAHHAHPRCRTLLAPRCAMCCGPTARQWCSSSRSLRRARSRWVGLRGGVCASSRKHQGHRHVDTTTLVAVAAHVCSWLVGTRLRAQDVLLPTHLCSCPFGVVPICCRVHPLLQVSTGGVVRDPAVHRQV